MKNHNELAEKVISTNFGSLDSEKATKLFLRLVEKFEAYLDVSAIAMEILGESKEYKPTFTCVLVDENTQKTHCYKETAVFVNYDNFSPRSESVEYKYRIKKTGWVKTEKDAKKVKDYQSFSGVTSRSTENEEFNIETGYEYENTSMCSPERWESYKPLPPF